MTMRRGRLALAFVAALMAAMLTPLVATAALLWTLTASPLAATTGTVTTFTLTATNGDLLAEIGCVVVDVPSNFSVKSTSVAATNANGSWTASRAANQVRVKADGGGARLELLEWVRFTIDAVPMSAGSLTWASNAYANQDCSGSRSLIGVPPIVVVTGPAVTPTPTPTPTPAPTPTPTPAPTPTPTATPTPAATSTPTPKPTLPPILPTLPPILPTLPPILPTLPPILPTPAPAATPTPTPAPTGTPATPSPGPSAVPPAASAAPGSSGGSPSPSTGPEASSGPTAGGGGGSNAQPGGLTTPRNLGGPADIELGLATTTLGSLGTLGWTVPGLVMTVPGLLLLLAIAAQAAGGLIWLPLARRKLGRSDVPDRTPIGRAGR